jgi:hypothetical protein
MSFTALFVHLLPFCAPILHIRYGGAVSLPQFHRKMYVKFVEITQITLILQYADFHGFCCYFLDMVEGHRDLHCASLFGHLSIASPTAATSPHSLYLAHKCNTNTEEFWL